MPTFLPRRRGVSQSEALAEAYTHATSNEVDLVTLSLYHPSFRNDDGELTAIHIVNDYEKLVATLEPGAILEGGQEVTFQALPFTLTLPDEVDGGAPADVTLEVDNVSREVTPYLNAAIESNEPIQATIRIYMASDTSAPAEDPPLTLTLRGANVTNAKLSAKVGYGELINRAFPRDTYSRDSHPALFA